MLDDVEYNKKPNKDEVKKINYRILKHAVDIEIENLGQELIKGKTFIPALLNKKHKGKVSRSIKSWSSQELICLDFDEGLKLNEALDIFKNEAAFIYTTFNHSEDKHKFRVVFVLDQIIENYAVFESLISSLFVKYPMADKSCSDGSRLFYGGRDIIVINFNNKLKVNDYISEKFSFGVQGVFSTLDTLIPNTIKGRKNPPSSQKTYDIIEINKKIDEYVSHQTQHSLEFTHIDDAYAYIYKQDIGEYLESSGYISKGTKDRLSCFFHDDDNSSVSIFRDKDLGNYLYRCHSSECKFTGNIIRVVQRLTGMKRVEAFKHLCMYYNIRIIETEWQKQKKEELDHNIHMLTSKDFASEYPEYYKRVKRYVPLLIMMNLLAKQYIGSNTLKELEMDIFTASKTYLSEMAKDFGEMIKEAYSDKLEYSKLNSDVKEIGKRIDLFAFLGVLNKVHVNDLPKELFKIAMIEKDKKKASGQKTNFPNYYSIPAYDDDLMTHANDKAIEFKENNMSMTGFGREMLIRSLSKDEANNVYPMMKELDLSNSRNVISEDTKKRFLRRVEVNGWVLEKEVLDEIISENLSSSDGQRKGKSMAMKNIKRILNELIEGYGLKRSRLNKELIKDLGIGEGVILGYPYIIYR